VDLTAWDLDLTRVAVLTIMSEVLVKERSKDPIRMGIKEMISNCSRGLYIGEEWKSEPRRKWEEWFKRMGTGIRDYLNGREIWEC
jgi:hypothetical protein